VSDKNYIAVKKSRNKKKKEGYTVRYDRQIRPEWKDKLDGYLNKLKKGI